MSTCDDTWEIYHPHRQVYRCIALLIPEEDGGYSIISTNLPGACSQGETVAEALENMREAFEGVLLSYRDDGVTPPWKNDPVDVPAGARLVRVSVELSE